MPGLCPGALVVFLLFFFWVLLADDGELLVRAGLRRAKEPGARGQKTGPAGGLFWVLGGVCQRNGVGGIIVKFWRGLATGTEPPGFGQSIIITGIIAQYAEVVMYWASV